MSGTNIISGTRQAQQQPIKLSRNETGSSSEVPYETTDVNQWVALVLQANISGVQYEAQSGFGKHTITHKYPFNISNDPTTEPPVNLWEMVSTKVQKSILDSNNPLANGLEQNDLNLLNQFLANVQQYLVQWDGTADPVPDNVGEIDSTKIKFHSDFANQMAALIISGVTSFDVFQPTLRFTQTVNNSYPLAASQVNVGKIISTDSMYFLAQVPAHLLFDLPNDSDPVTKAGKPVLHYGWFKNAPEVRQIARQKWQIIYSYEYGLWPEILYGAPL